MCRRHTRAYEWLPRPPGSTCTSRSRRARAPLRPTSPRVPPPEATPAPTRPAAPVRHMRVGISARGPSVDMQPSSTQKRPCDQQRRHRPRGPPEQLPDLPPASRVPRRGRITATRGGPWRLRTSWCPPLTTRSSTRFRSTVHSGLPDLRKQMRGCRDYLQRRMYQPATSTMRMATTKAHTVVAPWYER